MTLHLGELPTRNLVAIVAVPLLVVGACGSDAGEAADSTETDAAELDLAELTAALDEVEFDSAGLPAGPLLGDEPLADDGSAAATAIEGESGGPEQSEGSDRDPGTPDCAEFDDCDDEGPGLGPDAVAPEPFTPEPAWADFCTVLAEIEQREFPTEPFEALRVVDVWFGLLKPYVPAQIAADFGLLDRLLDDAVAAQDVGLLESSPPEVDAAGDRIGDAVDAQCAGR